MLICFIIIPEWHLSFSILVFFSILILEAFIAHYYFKLNMINLYSISINVFIRFSFLIADARFLILLRIVVHLLCV